MGELRIMGKPGDTKMIWNSANKDETEAARNTFDELKDKGYRAYKVKRDGGKGHLINYFDSKAGKIIMVPPMAGG